MKKEETSDMPNLGHGFVWFWNLDNSESRSKIPWK